MSKASEWAKKDSWPTADGTWKPFVELTKDDLEHIARLEEQPEETDEQRELKESISDHPIFGRDQ